MEYKLAKIKESKHVTPLFSALDSSYKGSKVLSSCERPCVCHCICKRSYSAIDSKKKENIERKTEELFKDSLAESLAA